MTAIEALSCFSNTELQIWGKYLADVIGSSDLFSAEEKSVLELVKFECCGSSKAKTVRKAAPAELWLVMIAFVASGQRLDPAAAQALIRVHWARFRFFCHAADFKQPAIDNLRNHLAQVELAGGVKKQESGWLRLPAASSDSLFTTLQGMDRQLSLMGARAILGRLLEMGKYSRVITADDYGRLQKLSYVEKMGERGELLDPEFILPLIAYAVYGERIQFARAAFVLRHDFPQVTRVFAADGAGVDRERINALRGNVTLIGQPVNNSRLTALVSRRAWKSFLRKADEKVFAACSARDAFVCAFVKAKIVQIDAATGEITLDSARAGVRFSLSKTKDGRLAVVNVRCLLPKDKRRLERLSKE